MHKIFKCLVLEKNEYNKTISKEKVIIQLNKS